MQCRAGGLLVFQKSLSHLKQVVIEGSDWSPLEYGNKELDCSVLKKTVHHNDLVFKLNATAVNTLLLVLNND